MKTKPTSPGRRSMVKVVNPDLHKGKPFAPLLEPQFQKAGRNNNGHITTRHKGGGHKHHYRVVDFKRNDKDGIPAKVERLEYDPNRTAFIALIEYTDGVKQYIVAPQQLKVGDSIVFSEKAPLTAGNRMKLKNILVGTSVYNVELEPGRGGILIRSAGSAAQVLAHEGSFVTLKMPSSEIRKVKAECFATVGIVSNPENRFYRVGKAGKSRLKGKRPHVRGSAMNPVDHPHGGGEGRQPIGLKHPKTPWGLPALGVKTRYKKKWTNKYIVSRRKKKK